MRPLPLLLLCTPLFLACSPSAPAPTPAPELSPAFSEADAFASQVSLPSLQETEGPELRVWYQEYSFGNTHGYIVRPGEITIVEIYPSADPPELREPRVSTIAAPELSVQFLETMPALRQVRFSNCGVAMDGAGLTIEGVDGGGRFALSQQNSHLCEVQNIEALQRLGALTQSADDAKPAPSP